MDLAPPQWLLDKCEFWVGVLRLDRWKIGVALALVVDGDPELAGCAEWDSSIHWGRVTLRVDCVHEWSEQWEATLVHELLHIKHGRVDDFFHKVVCPQVAAADSMLQAMYRSEIEPFIDHLSWALVELHQQKESS